MHDYVKEQPLKYREKKCHHYHCNIHPHPKQPLSIFWGPPYSSVCRLLNRSFSLSSSFCLPSISWIFSLVDAGPPGPFKVDAPFHPLQVFLFQNGSSCEKSVRAGPLENLFPLSVLMLGGPCKMCKAPVGLCVWWEELVHILHRGELGMWRKLSPLTFKLTGEE